MILPDIRRRDVFIVLIVTGVLIFFRTYLSLNDEGPTCFFDETLYRLNATAIFELRKAVHAHYPPLYSLIVSPTLLFEHWYEGMLIISSIFSSMIVPITWLLARILQLKNPMLPVLMSALLPMHAVYSKMLMSENAGVPLFVLAVALALHAGKRMAVCFGLILGLLHLTKYLYLPAIILLFIVWAVLLACSQSGDCWVERIRRATFPILLVLLSYLAVYGIWVLYGIASGFPVRTLFGFQISAITTGQFSESASLGSFFLWCVTYLSYVVLAWLPSWLLMGVWCVNGKIFFWRPSFNIQRIAFVLILFMLLGGYWILAVQHSFGASYNYPDPKYLIGRYLMHLSPLFIVFTFLIIEKLQKSWEIIHPVWTFVVVLLIVLVSFFARWILYDGGIFDLPHWFANITFNSIDSYQLGSVKNLSVFIIVLVIMPISIRIFRERLFFISLPWIVVSFLFLFQSTERARIEDRPIHAREISKFLNSNFSSLGKPVRIDISGISEKIETIQNGLGFWGIPADAFLLEKVEKIKDVSQDTLLLIQGDKIGCQVRHSYIFDDKEYSICQMGAH